MTHIENLIELINTGEFAIKWNKRKELFDASTPLLHTHDHIRAKMLNKLLHEIDHLSDPSLPETIRDVQLHRPCQQFRINVIKCDYR